VRSTPAAVARFLFHRRRKNTKASKNTAPRTPPTTPPTIFGVSFAPPDEPDEAAPAVDVDDDDDVADTAVAPSPDDAVEPADSVEVPESVDAPEAGFVVEKRVDAEASLDVVVEAPEVEVMAEFVLESEIELESEVEVGLELELEIESELEIVETPDVVESGDMDVDVASAAVVVTAVSTSDDAAELSDATLCVADGFEVSDIEVVCEDTKGTCWFGLAAMALGPVAAAAGAGLVATGDGRAPVTREPALAGTVRTPKLGIVSTAGRVETVNSPRVLVPLSISKSYSVATYVVTVCMTSVFRRSISWCAIGAGSSSAAESFEVCVSGCE
jgi:hypothetical protein